MTEYKSTEPVNQAEIITVKIYSEDEVFEDEDYQRISYGKCSVLGTRKNQQDSVFSEFKNQAGIAIVCDGMGGLQGGELASQIAAETLATDYFDQKEIENVPEFFRQEAIKTDQAVADLCDENGELLEAGTTLVSVIIQNGELFWLSVGDSKIYIIRKNEIMCVNRLHNYRMTMDEMLENNQITIDEYKEKEKQAEALISFIGMRNVSLMDINPRGFRLQDNDIILLSSDGLYRLLDDETIKEIIKRNMFDMDKAAKSLIDEAEKRVVHSQDNTSVVVVRYLEEII